MISEDFTAYAGKIHASFDQAQKADDLKGMVSTTISQIAKDCVEAGTRLIGHIKCIAEVESGKYIACSVVSHDAEAACRGELADGSKRLDLIINVLIYGLDKEKVENIVSVNARRVFEGYGARLEVENLEFKDSSHQCEDEHDSEHNH